MIDRPAPDHRIGPSGGASAVKIVLNADEPLARAGLLSLIRAIPSVEVTEDGAASDIVVAVMDRLRAGTMSRLRRAARAADKPIVLVLDELDGDGLLPAVGCGVVAVLPRRALTRQRLQDCLHTVLSGGAVMTPKLVGTLISHINRVQSEILGPNGLDVSGLTAREIDILRLIAEGRTTEEIAVELRFAERTVKNTLHTAIHRLNLKNRSHAVAYAIRAGLF